MDRSPADQIGLILLPEGTDSNGWTVSNPCANDANPHDELDDLPPGTNDGDGTCRQGSGSNRVGAALQDPVLTDGPDVDDFKVVTSAVVKKVASQPASISVDVKVGSSAYHVGSTQTTTTTYVRYSRTDNTNPTVTPPAEWTLNDVNGLVAGVRCADCNPNNRVTQVQAVVDALYNAEHALEVRFAWTNVSVFAESWYLVAECTRLSPGSENVLIQIGQGGTSPSSWRTVFTCNSDSDVAFDPILLNETEVNGGAPVVRLWDAQTDTPDDTVQGTMAMDVLRIDVNAIPSPSEGSVRSVLRSPGLRTATPVVGDFAPTARDYPTVIAYTTPWGNYSFPKAKPHLLELADQMAFRQVNASGFFLDSSPATAVSDSVVLSWNDTSFRARYNVTILDVVQGNVTTSYAFSATAPPKIAASFEKFGNSTVSWFRLVWRSQTANKYVQTGDSTVTYFGGFSQPTAIVDPYWVADVGEHLSRDEWSQQTRFDWQDAVGGELYVGPLAIPGEPVDSGVEVRFPVNESQVDPSVAGYTSDPYSTRFSTQRKTFQANGRYWVFFHSGSDVVYTSSRDGIAWTPQSATGVGQVYQSFDVDQAGSVVVMCWLAGNAQGGWLFFRLGVLRGGFIDWGARPTVIADLWTLGRTSQSPVSVAIGTDGFFWCGGSFAGVGPLNVAFRIYRSYDRLGSAFFESFSAPGNYRDAIQLVALSDGKLRAIFATYYASYVRHALYGPTGWSSVSIFDIRLSANCPSGSEASCLRDRTWSASADSKDVIHIGYRHETGQLGYATIGASPDTFGVLEAGPGVRFPTALVDLDDDVHFFWLKEGSSEIWHKRKSDLAWLPAERIFTELYRPEYLSAPRRSAGMAFLTWTTYSGPTFPAAGLRRYEVRFASLPLAFALDERGGEPWSREGLSPYESYFQQLEQFVSPGNGQLTIRQTDLFLPGRGVDLAITRIWKSPSLFVRDGGLERPYIYSGDVSSAFTGGWRLNLPGIEGPFLHLWDGQLRLVQFDENGVFENRQGDPFTLVRDPLVLGAFDLYNAAGVHYRLERNAFGRSVLRFFEDTRLNRITVTYDVQGRVDFITDTLSRVVDFSYGANGLLSTVSQGGRTIRYDYYASNRLWKVTDPKNRVTEFAYGPFIKGDGGQVSDKSTPCLDALTSPYLLRAVWFPTGGSVHYCYKKGAAGTEAYTYLVARQNTYDRGAVLLKSVSMGWTLLDGRVSYTNFTYSDTGTRGSEEYLFGDGLISRSVQVTRDELWRELQRRETYFDEEGRPMLRSTCKFAPGGGSEGSGPPPSSPNGASKSSSSTTQQGNSPCTLVSELSAYDNWGNVVYSRDRIGRESFSTYSNTDLTGILRRPAMVDRTTPGRILFYDFEDRALWGWKKEGTGSVDLNYTSFDRVPPTLNVTSTSSTSSVTAWHAIDPAVEKFTLSVVISSRETQKGHYIFAKAGGWNRIDFRLGSDGQMAYYDGFTYVPLPSGAYSANRWYRIAFRVIGSTTYDIYVDGVLKKQGAPLLNSGNVDRIDFQSSALAGMWIAEVRMDSIAQFPGGGQGSYLTIDGLRWGQWATLVDPWSGLSAADRVDYAWDDTVTLAVPPNMSPKAFLTVFDNDGTMLLQRPQLYFGGDRFSFNKARDFQPFVRVKSGFALYDQPLWFDDGVLPGWTENDDEDTWIWAQSPSAPAGTSVHLSPVVPPQHNTGRPGYHQHSFADAVPTLQPISSSYHVQYVFLPEGSRPAQIHLGLRDDLSPSAWYWARWGDSPGATGTTWMGALPPVSNRWVLLMSKPQDIGTSGKTLDGAAFGLVGGSVYWDVTGVDSRSSAADVVVRGLRPGQKVELLSDQDQIIASGTASEGQPWVSLGVYLLGVRTAFPIPGRFRILDAEGGTFVTEYESPRFDLWPADEFSYAGATAPPSQAVNERNHRALQATSSFTDWSHEEVLSLDMETPLMVGSAATTDDYLRDGSGLANHAQVSGTLPVAGMIGLARDFRGPTYQDYLVVPASGSLVSPRGFTVAFFLYLDALPLDTNQRVYVLTAGDSSVSVPAWDVRLRWVGPLNSDWDLEFRLRTYTCVDPWFTIARHIWTGSWIHVAGTYDGQTQRLYFNGYESVGSSVDIGSLLCMNALPIYVGKGGFPSNSAYLDGRVDELMVASRALTAAQVRQLGPDVERPFLVRSTNTLDVHGDPLSSNVRGRAAVRWTYQAHDSYGNAVEQTGPAGDRVTFAYQSGPPFYSSYLTGVSRFLEASYMETILRPNGNGDVNEWTIGGSGTSGCTNEANEWQCLDESSSDGDATFVSSSGLATTSLYALTDYGPGTPRVSFVELRALARAETGGVGEIASRIHLRLGIARSEPFLLGSAYAMLTFRFYANPTSSRTWTAQDLDALQAGVELAWTNTGPVRVTQIEVIIVRTVSGTDMAAAYDYYPDTGLLKQEVDAEGNPTDYAYDALGRLTTKTLPAVAGVRDTVAYNYNDAQSSVTITNERGYQTRRWFDGIGRLTKVERLTGFGSALVEEFRDDWRDQLVWYKTAEGHVYRKQYDYFGRVTLVTNPDGTYTSTAYDDAANTVTTEARERDNTLRRKTVQTYDDVGQLVESREFASDSTSYSGHLVYDGAGALLLVQDAKGQTTSHRYDEFGRLTETVYPDYGSEAQTYDDADRVLTRRDRAGNVAFLTYDSLGRVKSVADPVGSLSYTYDKNGNVLTVSGTGTDLVSYAYDGRQRVTSETTRVDDTDYAFTFGYDKTGNLERVTYPDATEVVYTYDAFNHVGAVYAPGYVADVGYNRDNPVSINVANGLRTSYGYDALGRVRQVKTYREASFAPTDYSLPPVGDASVQWADYPSAGANFQKVDDPPDPFAGLGDGDATYVYESTIGESDLYHMEDLPAIGSATIDAVYIVAVAKATHIQAEDDAKLILKLRIGGVDYRSTPQVLNTKYSVFTWFWQKNPATGQPWTKADVDALQAGIEVGYVDFGTVRVTQVYLHVPTSASVPSDVKVHLRYTYDASSDIVRIENLVSGVTEDYGYDLLGRLTSATTAGGGWGSFGWTYDEAGNRLTQTEGQFLTSYSNGPNNRLDSYQVSGQTPVAFAYDANGNMQTRTQSGGDTWSYTFNARDRLIQVTKNGQTVASFAYDPAGRRVKSVESSTTTYVFAGSQPLFEKDLSTGLTTKHLMLGGLRLAKITGSGTFYYHQDALGSVRAVTDGARNVVFQAGYRPFGELDGASGTEAYTYVGEHRDSTLNLHYFGERFYEPTLGRFISLDPVLGAAEAPQTLNRYAYAGNNPLRNADPSGRFWNIVAGAVIGAVFSGVAYTVSTLVTGQEWNWGDFGRSLAVGAVSGALASICPICGPSLGSNLAGGALMGAGIGALGYALERGIQYLQTGSLEWNWGEFGVSVAVGAIAGAIGGALRFRSMHGVVTQTNQARGAILAQAGGGRGGAAPGKIGAAGVDAIENRLERNGLSILGGGGRVRVELPGGGIRVYDALSGAGRRLFNVFHEVKAGLVSMTDDIASQIAKDSVWVAAGNRVTWHLIAGASDDVLSALLSAGVKVVRYV